MSAVPAEEPRTLSEETRVALRHAMEFDPWLFSLIICKRDPKAERHHRPLLYLYTRRAALIVVLLQDDRYAGPVVWQIRGHLERRGIPWREPRALPLVAKALRRVNIRWPRSSGKSTFADDGDLWDVTCDPNMTVSIGSKTDPYTYKRIAGIGEFVKSPEYAYFFPDRVPLDFKTEVTERAIWINGRTRIGTPEASIEGHGINTPWTGSHYRKNRRDDIVGTESGDASLDDALVHMANIDAIHDETGWVQDVFIGTINGEDDDHAVLESDETVMSVVVPIETHDNGTTLKNIYNDGELQMPEWFDRERTNEIKNNARKNKEHGPIYLLQNYYMAAHKSGTTMFTHDMLARATFEWFKDEKSGKTLIKRPKKGKEAVPRDALTADDWFYLDPKTLPRTALAIGTDQSVAENGSSDKWAMVLVYQDWEGVYYVVDCIAERGYDQMLSTMNPFDRKCGKPLYWALDTHATQSMTQTWMKREAEYQDIARRVVPIASNIESKDVNIRNWLQANMLTGDLYIAPAEENPYMHRYRVVMTRYRPYHADGRKRRNPIDDELDATWMAMSVVRRPPSPFVTEEELLATEVERMREEASYDEHGLPKVNWLDCMWRKAS